MSQSRSKVAVGSFVLGALALLVLGIALLGGGNLLSDDLEYRLYFDGSVSGLSVGAPVVFRGVPLGSVTHISLEANPRDGSVTIPVHIRINERAIGTPRPREHFTDEERIAVLGKLVQRGLRARLQLQSLITGQYRVELDFYPNAPAKYRSNDPRTEIPTMTSPIDQLQRSLASLPLKEMTLSLQDVLTRLSDILASSDIERGLKNFADTFGEAHHLLLASRETQQAITMAAPDLSRLSAQAAGSLPASLTSLSQTLEAYRQVALSTQALVGRNAPAVNELQSLLREANAAMRALRALAETLQRNPESLLLGRHGGRR